MLLTDLTPQTNPWSCTHVIMLLNSVFSHETASRYSTRGQFPLESGDSRQVGDSRHCHNLPVSQTQPQPPWPTPANLTAHIAKAGVCAVKPLWHSPPITSEVWNWRNT